MQDVRIAQQHQVLKPPAKGILFAGRHGYVQGVCDLLEARQVVVGNGFLEMVDAEFFEAPPLLNGGGDGVAVVGVEAQIFAASEELPCRLEQLVVLLRVDVLPPPAPVHANLEGAKAALPAVLHQCEHLVRLHPPARAGAPVKRNGRAAGAAHQRVYGQACVLAQEVPQRHVDNADHPARQLVEALVPAEGERLPVPIHQTRIFACQRRPDGAFQVSVEDGVVAAGNLGPAFDAGISLNA